MRGIKQSFMEHVNHRFRDLNATPFGFEMCTTNQAFSDPRAADFLWTLGMKPHSYTGSFFESIVRVGFVQPQAPKQLVWKVVDNRHQNAQITLNRLMTISYYWGRLRFQPE